MNKQNHRISINSISEDPISTKSGRLVVANKDSIVSNRNLSSFSSLHWIHFLFLLTLQYFYNGLLVIGLFVCPTMTKQQTLTISLNELKTFKIVGAWELLWLSLSHIDFINNYHKWIHEYCENSYWGKMKTLITIIFHCNYWSLGNQKQHSSKPKFSEWKCLWCILMTDLIFWLTCSSSISKYSNSNFDPEEEKPKLSLSSLLNLSTF